MFEPEQQQSANSYLATSTSMSEARRASVHVADPAISEKASLSNQTSQHFVENCSLRLPAPGSCPFGSICHACPIISASPQSPDPADAGIAEKQPSNLQPRPFTAALLEARIESSGCQIPAGQYGVSKTARFRIFDFEGKPVNTNSMISERFSKIEGPEEIYRLLTPNSKPAEKGYFNDCYRLRSSVPLPSDLRLVVEQNHLLGDEIISKNKITFTPNNILICIYPRSSGDRNFKPKCKLF